MNTIEQVLKMHGTNNSCVFVFPSEIAANRWSEQFLVFSAQQAVAQERFIAWDTFKKQSVQSKVAGKKSVSTVLRKLFAENLLIQNRLLIEQGKNPLFTSIIESKFAADFSPFVSWIASLLPALEGWKNLALATQTSTGIPDAEDKDFLALHDHYKKFMEANNLFEPAWEKPPLNQGSDTQYFIFYPETISDFDEYETLLRQSPSVHIIQLEANKTQSPLHLFTNTREELKALALEIKAQAAKGIAYTDMAISVPGLDELEPYLLRELQLHQIPVQYRLGKALGQEEGRIFSLIQNCLSSDFSFISLKALLLYHQIPWKNTILNTNLIDFGIKNNCVCSYTEKNQLIDIWEEGFRLSSGDEQLRLYYAQLKKALQKMKNAASFKDLRTAWFIFRDTFLDIEQFTPKADKVLSRCIEELTNLIYIEQEFPAIQIQNPFQFFVSYLSDKNYVLQNTTRGVSIFPYRVAAATPYACHFVINLSHSDTTVVYKNLPFLAQSKRKALLLSDTNATDAFLLLYTSPQPAQTFYFCSQHTFSGYATEPVFFSGRTLPRKQALNTQYSLEKSWWQAGLAPDAQDKLEVINESQHEGFTNWIARQGNSSPAEHHSHPLWSKLSETMQTKKHTDGLLRISASDLSDFYLCPLQWLYSRIVGVEEFSLEAQLLDTAGLGNLYHEIIRTVMDSIIKTDPILLLSKFDDYAQLIETYSADRVYNFPAFKGPLAAPLLQTQIKNISSRLKDFFEVFLEYFNGFRALSTEKEFKFEKDNSLFYGRIDCVLYDEQTDEACIVDYKTRNTPSRKECRADEQESIVNFQMPMYISLCENTQNTTVGRGVFFSILQKKPLCITGSLVNSQTGVNEPYRSNDLWSRDDYEKTMQAFYQLAQDFGQKIEQHNYTHPQGIAWQTCLKCPYKNLCRRTYKIGRNAECHIAK